jgi:hypothetical protein
MSEHMINLFKAELFLARAALLALTVCLGSFAGITDVSAHHAFTVEFDAQKPVQLEGTIQKVEWINPHSIIHIVVKDADGKDVLWTVTVGSPNALVRLGLTKDSFGPGTQVRVSGFRARDGSNKVSGRTITSPDGKPLFQGGASQGG